MTDADLIQKKLAFIETCLQELRSLANLDTIELDVKERRFIEHTLQVCVQAVQDVASHIVSDARLGEPRTNQELFSLLTAAGWLSPDLAAKMRAAVGFRNVLVHGYTVVDLDILRDVVTHRLGDLESFVREIRAQLARRG
ncbi:MAG: DUF86 domain-containing protein [Polyangiaceae bacterium]|nr:DUF86 domain-containing protein [Polyangiaceae bacterium]